MRARNGGLVATVVSLMAVASACTSSVPPGMAVVTGGITPCSALGPVPSPHYAAGTVTVLIGKPFQRGNQGFLPIQQVTKVNVAEDQTYRLVPKPGDYVLKAKFRPINGLQPNIEPWTAISLRAGQELSRDIPNMCI